MDMIDHITIGKLIKQFRLQKGYTQAKAAEALHCTRSAYSYKENGTTSFSIEDIQLLANLFCVSPDIFFHPELCPNLMGQQRAKRKKP